MSLSPRQRPTPYSPPCRAMRGRLVGVTPAGEDGSGPAGSTLAVGDHPRPLDVSQRGSQHLVRQDHRSTAVARMPGNPVQVYRGGTAGTSDADLVGSGQASAERRTG